MVKVPRGVFVANSIAYCSKGYMFISHSKILQNAITKEGLENPNKNYYPVTNDETNLKKW